MDIETLNLLDAAKEIRDELEDRYDGAPDSETLWMGRHMERLDVTIGAVVRKIDQCLSVYRKGE